MTELIYEVSLDASAADDHDRHRFMNIGSFNSR